MTKDEKELLLRDLCARLPYKPKIQWDCADYDLLALENCEPIFARIMDDRPYSYATHKPLEEIKPYLRPMSSMTEEETKIYQSLQDTACSYHYEWGYLVDELLYFDNYASLDYLNSIHVDYRGLIDKGLALEAKEEMYNETNTEEI